jgi:hypothetical protein
MTRRYCFDRVTGVDALPPHDIGAMEPSIRVPAESSVPVSASGHDPGIDDWSVSVSSAANARPEVRPLLLSRASSSSVLSIVPGQARAERPRARA